MRAIAASLIGIIAMSILATHAWLTWNSVDQLPRDTTPKEREDFQYSLFLESFAFMVSGAYWFGPRIYRLFHDDQAAKLFEGQKAQVSILVNLYAAIMVIVRRGIFDQKMGVPGEETFLAILVICLPVLLTFISKIRSENR